ncbi:MAG: SpoIIE family protein phosphatase [Clostridiales bacterium]|nr:SpoIIE family protein phosphatase [Clostridiales bacterium]
MEWTKYILSMIVGWCLLILFGKKGDGRDKWLMGAGAGTSLAAMELTIEYMLNKAAWEMALSIMKGGTLMSAVVLMGYAWEWIRDRNKRTDEKEVVHPIRQWMDEYQESFAQLSRSFCMVPQVAEGQSRGDRIMQNRLMENRMAAAGQLREMSQILVGTMERIYSTREDEGLEQEIGNRLRLLGIQVHKAFFYGPKGKKRQVYITMRTRRKICVPVKKIAATLSDLMECEMTPARDSRSFVSQERVTVLFVEGTAYNVLYGMKKATRQNEAVSGDNFSVFWLPEGRFYAGLSDGMGSGIQACAQSELVLDLLEQFLEAGFSKETAVRMINSSIVLQPDAPVFSTVDLASVDLYTGVCDFLKVGAAASFLRKENGVECIHGTGLPAGVSSQLVLEPYRLRMYDGNLLFLVTDGIISALPPGQEEEILKKLIWELPAGTPSEMAERLMEQVRSYGGAVDDMTILVVGIWKR